MVDNPPVPLVLQEGFARWVTERVGRPDMVVEDPSLLERPVTVECQQESVGVKVVAPKLLDLVACVLEDVLPSRQDQTLVVLAAISLMKRKRDRGSLEVPSESCVRPRKSSKKKTWGSDGLWSRQASSTSATTSNG